jgi:hypothetical protein
VHDSDRRALSWGDAYASADVISAGDVRKNSYELLDGTAYGFKRTVQPGN